MGFDINTSTILTVFRGGGVLAILSSILQPGYSITYGSGLLKGSSAIKPTSFVSVDAVGEAAISTAPTEAVTENALAGGYVAYNKVKQPSVIRVVFTFESLSGFSGAIPNIFNLTLTSRTDVIERLESMVNSAGLYDIETPDKTYEGYDLIHYDYSTSANKGITLLTVAATFQEVNTTMEVALTSTNKANKKTNKTKATSTTEVNASTSAANRADINSALSSLSQSVTGMAGRGITDILGAQG